MDNKVSLSGPVWLLLVDALIKYLVEQDGFGQGKEGKNNYTKKMKLSLELRNENGKLSCLS